LTIILLVLVKFPEFFPFLPPSVVPKSQLYGYDVIFKEGSKYIRDKEVIVLSDRYQNAAQAQYYLEGKPKVYMLTFHRPSNYTYWQEELKGKKIKEAIFFDQGDNQEQMKQFFARVELLDVLRYENRFVQREYKVYRCLGYKK